MNQVMNYLLFITFFLSHMVLAQVEERNARTLVPSPLIQKVILDNPGVSYQVALEHATQKFVSSNGVYITSLASLENALEQLNIRRPSFMNNPIKWDLYSNVHEGVRISLTNGEVGGQMLFQVDTIESVSRQRFDRALEVIAELQRIALPEQVMRTYEPAKLFEPSKRSKTVSLLMVEFYVAKEPTVKMMAAKVYGLIRTLHASFPSAQSHLGRLGEDYRTKRGVQEASAGAKDPHRFQEVKRSAARR